MGHVPAMTNDGHRARIAKRSNLDVGDANAPASSGGPLEGRTVPSTLGADPAPGDALRRFDRPAQVIGDSRNHPEHECVGTSASTLVGRVGGQKPVQSKSASPHGRGSIHSSPSADADFAAGRCVEGAEAVETASRRGAHFDTGTVAIV